MIDFSLFLRYDRKRGKLFWKLRNISWFKTSRSWKIWNTKYAGKEAGTVHSHGYWSFSLLGKVYKRSRVVWYFENGCLPEKFIDHIDGKILDDRYKNLRHVSHQENMKNKKIPSQNTSGVMGVRWKSQMNKWNAFISPNNRQIHLGYFDKKEEAIKARKEAETRYGFHKNHGRK